MYELREKLCEEMERIARKENLGMSDLDTLHKLASTIKNLDKIMLREEGRYSREGYSRDGEWQADMRGTYALCARPLQPGTGRNAGQAGGADAVRRGRRFQRRDSPVHGKHRKGVNAYKNACDFEKALKILHFNGV